MIENNFSFQNVINIIFHLLLASILGGVIKFVSNTFFKSISTIEILWLFAIISILIISIFLKEIILYWNSKKVVFKNFMEISYYFILTYLTFSIGLNKINSIYHLILILILASLTYYFSCTSFQSIQRNHNKYHNEKSDLPITDSKDLFPTRIMELERIHKFIVDIDIDYPYALAINGEWGEGKTSFVNVLSDKLNQDGNEIIYIQPMILDTREKLLSYFFEQIEQVLHKNKIYTGENSPYKNYLEILIKILNNKNFSNVFNIFNSTQKNNKSTELRSLKNKLEENIKILTNKGNRIVILIDDLDRVEPETVYNLLTFVKEIVDLKGILTIFTVDYRKITSDKITIEYLEKFIDSKFSLKKISSEEIFKHYFKIFKKDYKNDILNNFYNQITNEFLEYISILEKKSSSILEKNSESTSNDEEKIKDIKRKYLDLDKKLKNARNIKKIVANVEENFSFMDDEITKNSSNIDITNYMKNEINISEIILNLSIFKILFREYFDRIVQLGSYEAFINDENEEFIIKLFFNGNSLMLTKNEKQKEIERIKIRLYDFLIFSDKLHHSILMKIKTEEERLLEKLYNIDNVTEKSTEDWNFISINKLHSAIRLSPKEKESVHRDKFIRIIISSFKNKQISALELLSLLKRPQRTILFDNEKFLNEFFTVLKDENLGIELLKNKQSLFEILSQLKDTAIFSLPNFLSMLIYAYKAGTSKNIIKYEGIEHIKSQNSVYSFKNIEGLNASFVHLLKNENLSKDILSKNTLRENVELIKNDFSKHVNNIDIEIVEAFKYNYERIDIILNILDLKEKIEDYINQYTDNNIFELESLYMNNFKKSEISKKINIFYKTLKKKEVSHEDYRLFHGLISALKEVDKKNLKQEDVKKIRELSNIFKKSFEKDETMFDINTYHYMQIAAKEIINKFEVMN